MFLYSYYSIQSNIFEFYAHLFLFLYNLWTLLLSIRIGISPSECHVSTSINCLQNAVIDIFLPVSSWNKTFIAATFKKSSKANFLHHLTVFLNELQLIRKINSGVSCILFNDHFWFTTKPVFCFYIYVISLEFFIEKTKTSLLSFYFKTLIPLLFSLVITFPLSIRYFVITSFRFLLRFIRSIPIKCIFSLLVYSPNPYWWIRYQYMRYGLYETYSQINPWQCLMVLYFICSGFFFV